MPGPGRRGHRARARPARADHHAERRDLVLGLHDRERGLPGRLVHPVSLHVADERLAERRRGRDRIPGDDGDARHHAADRRRGISLDENLAGRFVHRLDDEWVLLREGRLRIVIAGLERALVERDSLGLAPQLLAERLFHQLQVDAEDLGEDAVVDHVADEPPQLRVGTDRGDQLVERDRVEHQVAAERVELQRLVVDDGGARIQRQHVFLRRLGVHRDEEVDFLLPGDVAALAGPNRVPGGQPGDVGREHVLAGHGNAHQENRTEEHEVGRLAARAIDGGDLDAEIVDDPLLARRSPLLLNR